MKAREGLFHSLSFTRFCSTTSMIYFLYFIHKHIILTQNNTHTPLSSQTMHSLSPLAFSATTLSLGNA